MSKLLMQGQLSTILKLMKYSIQPAVFYEPLEKFLKSFDNLEFLSFNNLTKHEKDRRLMEYNPNPRVLMCQYAGGSSDEKPPPFDCDLFHISMTNNGIGYTFNNVNFWDMFSKTTYTEMFSKIMTPKGFDKDPTTDEHVCLGIEIKVILEIGMIFTISPINLLEKLNIQFFRQNQKAIIIFKWKI